MDICFIVLVICGAVLGLVSFFVGYYIFKKLEGRTVAKILVTISPLMLALMAFKMYNSYIQRGDDGLDWLGISLTLLTMGFVIWAFIISIISLKKSNKAE